MACSKEIFDKLKVDFKKIFATKVGLFPGNYSTSWTILKMSVFKKIYFLLRVEQ